MGFLEDYKRLLSSAYKAVITNHGSEIKNYEFVAMSHIFSDNWDEQMSKLLVKNLLSYCYSEKEFNSPIFSNVETLEEYIVDAIRNRLNKKIGNDDVAQKDGLTGELLLDLILRMENADATTLICRPLYQQQGSRQELKSYDALLFIKNETQMKLLLGQVKTGTLQNCKIGIKSDLNNKYKAPYFGNAMCWVSSRLISSNGNPFENIIKEMNEISRLKDKNAKHNNICSLFKTKNILISIPCLLLYTQADVYKIAEDLKKLVLVERDSILSHFKDEKFDLTGFDYEIIFYIFPAKDVSILRSNLMKIKQEVFTDDE